VYELLQENGLGDFYRLADKAGVQAASVGAPERFVFLDEPSVRRQLLEYSDERVARVTFHVPGMHCVACVWLLENLFKLREGIGRSVADFGSRRVTIHFDPARLELSDVAALLASIGYEPVLRLDSAASDGTSPHARRLHLKLGVAGFAFGNIMLFSVCLYSGMDRFSAPMFKPLFGWVSLVLALPVLLYSASDWWRAAWWSLRQRALTLDVPIAIGLVALFAQSLTEVVQGRGVGYLDSMTGLIFFLLLGRVFQDMTHRRLSFDRDYKAFFPLAVKRKTGEGERPVPLSELGVGDRILLRRGELIPADARIVEGTALVDYSFVTGEADPVEHRVGDEVQAGGQQVGALVELEIVRPVSQSYLTSLWSHETFAKVRDLRLKRLLNRFSRWFTLAVVALAVGAAAWWWPVDSGRALRAFTAVLIVACPCALALSAPFALGTAQRLLARRQIFVKNTDVIEGMASADTVVFDKTGTLTSAAAGPVAFVPAVARGGLPGRADGKSAARLQDTDIRSNSGNDGLTTEERRRVHALAGVSTHPHSTRIAAALELPGETAAVRDFVEERGMGVAGRVEGVPIWLGSAEWLRQAGVVMPSGLQPGGSMSHLAINDTYRGSFRLEHQLRPQVDVLLTDLARRHDLALLSGDNDRDAQQFRQLLGDSARLAFQQAPVDKLQAIASLQAEGRRVVMVGDGLNDAGALRQSDVGVAVVERIGTFSPASDVIMEADRVPALATLLRFARGSVRVVWAAMLLSLLYNAVGLTFAASGRLSPILCAILMPLSSITVVAFACLAVNREARRAGVDQLNPAKKGME